MAECVNCGEPIRRVEAADGIDPRDYAWVHESGNAFCDLTPLQASPGGDGYGPAPLIGYLIDGRLWHPSDVTIVRQGAEARAGCPDHRPRPGFRGRLVLRGLRLRRAAGMTATCPTRRTDG